MSQRWRTNGAWPPLEGSSTGSRHRTQCPPKAVGHVDEQQINRRRSIAAPFAPPAAKNLSTPLIGIPEHPLAYVSCHHMLRRWRDCPGWHRHNDSVVLSKFSDTISKWRYMRDTLIPNNIDEPYIRIVCWTDRFLPGDLIEYHIFHFYISILCTIFILINKWRFNFFIILIGMFTIRKKNLEEQRRFEIKKNLHNRWPEWFVHLVYVILFTMEH